MKLLKIFVISFFVLGFFSSVHAVDQVSLATVNIQDAQIISQKDTTLTVRFNLSNKEGLQSGVKYGIKLFAQDTKGHPSFLVDEKVYDESLTLLPKSTTNKEVVYIAPSTLTGTYSVVVTSSNDKGFPFGISSLGEIKLVATTQGLIIVPGSCTVQIQGDSVKQLYGLSQNVSFSGERNPYLTCYVTNTSKKPLQALPTYETRTKDMYGQTVANLTTGTNAMISFKSLEKKGVSVLLPKAQTPGTYTVKMSLVTGEGTPVSAQVLYTIKGASASVLNLSLDKDYYKSGETAHATLVWLAKDTLDLGARILVEDSHGDSCIKDQNIPLTSKIKAEFTLPIRSTCFSPHITVALVDQSGQVLDQKVFDIQTKTAVYKKSYSSLGIILGAIFVFLVILFGMYIKKRKDGILFGTKILIFLIIPLGLAVYAPSAHAGTFAVGGTITTVNIDKGTGGNYNPGEDIVVTGNVQSGLSPELLSLTANTNGSPDKSLFGSAPVFGNFACWIDPNNAMGIFGPGLVCGLPIVGYTVVPFGTATFTAPTTPGNYSVVATLGIKDLPTVTSAGCSMRPMIGGTIDDFIECSANMDTPTDIDVTVNVEAKISTGAIYYNSVVIPAGETAATSNQTDRLGDVKINSYCVRDVLNAILPASLGC